MKPLTFGKHKGTPIELVSVEYLAWCVKKMEWVPKEVIEELRARAVRYGSRDCGVAAGAVSGFEFRISPPKEKSCRPLKERKVRKRKQRKQQAQRDLFDKTLFRSQSTPVVGEHFDRLRVAHLQAGGDFEDCPFDVPDEPYQGPELYFSGGLPQIAPPEFYDHASQEIH